MVSGPDDGLYVSIPAGDGSIHVALLGSNGRPLTGWPVVLAAATDCPLLLPAEDGSVRVVCRPDELNQELNNGLRMYAFDSTGRKLAGWPVDHDGFVLAGRMVGDDLTVFTLSSAGDVVEEGQPLYLGAMVTVAADGAMRSGTQLPIFDSIAPCCHRWAVGPDGLGYGVMVGDAPEASRITALDRSGVRRGWPVSFYGIGSPPAFGPRGRIFVTVGSYDWSRIDVFDRDGETVSASSADLPLATLASQEDLDASNECGVHGPQPPLVAKDGTTFLISRIETAVYGLDPTLNIKSGWPFKPATPIERRFDFPERHDCGSLAIPAIGADATLYLPLQARTQAVGGSLVAVGANGRVRTGWPVELKRPGSEFWSVSVGADGTIYALAIEPEPNKTSSASILAIAPDSRVLYTTTIIDP